MTQRSPAYQPLTLARRTAAHWRRCYPAVDICLAFLAFAGGFVRLLGPENTRDLTEVVTLTFLCTMLSLLQNKILRTRLVGYGVTSSAVALTALGKLLVPSVSFLAGSALAQIFANQQFLTSGQLSPGYVVAVAAVMPVPGLVLLRATRGRNRLHLRGISDAMQMFLPACVAYVAWSFGMHSEERTIEIYASYALVANFFYLAVSTVRERHLLLHPQP